MNSINPAVGNVELAVEIERTGIGIAAVLGDLAVVDVTRQFGGVLVLLVLGLKGPDADTVLLGQDQPADLDVFDDLCPVTVVAGHEQVETVAVSRIEFALDMNVAVGVVDRVVQLGLDLLPERRRDQLQRLFVHRAFDKVSVALFDSSRPRKRVQRPLRAFRIRFKPSFQSPDDGALGTPYGSVEQNDALFCSKPLCGRLEYVDQFHQRNLEAVHRIVPFGLDVVKKLVTDYLFLVFRVLFRSVGHDHVVNPLIRGAHHSRIGYDDAKIVLERSSPIHLLKFFGVLSRLDEGDDLICAAHTSSCSARIRHGRLKQGSRADALTTS